jgi:hypothetical protein
MKTTNTTTLYNEGCRQGQALEYGGIVLYFGRPAYRNGTYGTILYSNAFAPISAIEQAAKAFLAGYWACSPPSAGIRLVIGTSNYGGSVTYAHGSQWAQLVTRVNSWISSPPSYASKETAAGGSDMELGWNTASVTRAWANGYVSVYQWPYYNYGDCSGCPSKTHPTWRPDNNWTQEDVWYVSWGAPPAWPLPEIYNSTMAGQWQYMSLYSYTHHDGRMIVKGAMTQRQACQDLGSACPGTNNTPAQGWSQLWDALNSDARTAQSLDWSTDITYQN